MPVEQEHPKSKQTYEKPKLRMIELAAEEVLGGGCKTSSSGASGGAAPCTNGPCQITIGTS